MKNVVHQVHNITYVYHIITIGIAANIIATIRDTIIVKIDIVIETLTQIATIRDTIGVGVDIVIIVGTDITTIRDIVIVGISRIIITFAKVA